MPSGPLNEAASVTLDGSGNGTLKMTPFGGGATWQPTLAAVKASSHVLEAQCRIYVGPSPVDQYFVAGTLSGSTGDSTDQVGGYSVDTHGSALWAVWTGGDAGAQATMSVNGTETIP